MVSKHRLVLLVVVCLAPCVGCGLQNRAVRKHSCEECRHRPMCGFETLEPRYCVQCSKPLDGSVGQTDERRSTPRSREALAEQNLGDNDKAALLLKGPEGNETSLADDFDNSWDEMIEQISLEVEGELDNWDPTQESTITPLAAISAPDIDIAGTWVASGSTLEVHRNTDHFDVMFSTGGSVRWWKLNRAGRFNDGVLALDRPVKEYCPMTYSKLFAVRVAGEEFLVPSVRLAQFQIWLSADGTPQQAMWTPRLYSFRRKAWSNIELAAP